jgi:hypothetical protein
MPNPITVTAAIAVASLCQLRIGFAPLLIAYSRARGHAVLLLIEPDIFHAPAIKEAVHH